MPTLSLYKMTRDISYFVKGQKVWEVFSTGDLSYKCIGRFRGKGRWVMGWVHVRPHEDYKYRHNKPDCDWKGEVIVSEDFYQYYRRIVAKIVKSPYWDVHGI